LIQHPSRGYSGVLKLPPLFGLVSDRSQDVSLGTDVHLEIHNSQTLVAGFPFVDPTFLLEPSLLSFGSPPLHAKVATGAWRRNELFSYQPTASNRPEEGLPERPELTHFFFVSLCPSCWFDACGIPVSTSVRQPPGSGEVDVQRTDRSSFPSISIHSILLLSMLCFFDGRGRSPRARSRAPSDVTGPDQAWYAYCRLSSTHCSKTVELVPCSAFFRDPGHAGHARPAHSLCPRLSVQKHRPSTWSCHFSSAMNFSDLRRVAHILDRGPVFST